jgi:hypothetical protein
MEAPAFHKDSCFRDLGLERLVSPCGKMDTTPTIDTADAQYE